MMFVTSLISNLLAISCYEVADKHRSLIFGILSLNMVAGIPSPLIAEIVAETRGLSALFQ